MLTTVMNGARQSLGSADGLAETVGAPSLREKGRVGRRWWTMRRSDGARRRRPPRSVSPGRWGACGGHPHGRVDGDRVSRAIGGVLRSTREEGARLRVPPRGRGTGDDQWCSPPSSRAPPLPPLGESAVVGEVGLLVVIPPSPRFALPGRHGPGAEAGEAARSGPAAAPPPLSEPARPPAPTASHCGPRHRSPNSNHSRAGASQEPPPRQGTHPAPPIREIAG